MNSETAHCMQCLQQIHKVISKANEILAGISQPSVCSEVLLSAQGTTYILGLSEVYRVSRRLEEGLRTQELASEPLQLALRQVDLAWNNMLSFLVFGHPAFHILLLEAPLGSSSCQPEPNPAPDQICRVCLTEVKQEPECVL
ncbi:synergin gamma-like isoform X2 [Hemicordylus capensis]|uniref:synergin gamma-like isoform X2 n=1 Tax=Hemicordylus capensis TaxID=884348 RepID=UPI00230284D3|nr:synergin gamma-like isoform X2 [Hemicordylus capensis]